MKNVIVYIDPTTSQPVAKAMATSHAAFEAMKRAGKKGIKALYCAPEDVERVKGDLVVLAKKSPAPIQPKPATTQAKIVISWIAKKTEHRLEVWPEDVETTIATLKASGHAAKVVQ